MSSDLLKEFGELGENHSPQLGQGSKVNDSLEDDFGDFEGPDIDSADNGKAKPLAHTVKLPTSYDDLGPEPHSNSPPALKGMKDWEVPNERPLPNTFGSQQSNAEIEPSGPDWSNYKGGTVLFDAEAETPPKRPSVANEAANEAVSAPAIYFDDQLDEWEPEESAEQALEGEVLESQARTPAVSEISTVQVPSIKPDITGSPPANVPPPSILLPLCTSFLQSLPTKLKTLSNETEQSRTIFLHDISYLRAIAHILAGRKLRWKRDTLLSQSMKIGPAGKQGGMKLTGVDRTESRREDQEAAEVLRVWRQRIGLLRSTVATFRTCVPTSSLVLPEMAESMPVRLGKVGEGAVMAPKACFLCGVKRDERVLKVDVDVEDSFGEWWKDHWGHVDCVGFWFEQKTQLAQR